MTPEQMIALAQLQKAFAVALDSMKSFETSEEMQQQLWDWISETADEQFTEKCDEMEEDAKERGIEI